ncbi:MAG TPA: glycosyltransferase family 2 protein, partial [Planctomycetota bacterium]|nr:glycosyltransferase family 2 protein [Planctomycetota bacterium]
MASPSLSHGRAAPGAVVADGPQPELSVVLPCLDEADTVAACVEKAWRALRESGIDGEVIVADNGSRDGSPELAAAAGARVVHVAERGYGSALAAGIAAARGRWVLMGDADDSYDFGELPAFVAKLREGFELVQGCRLPSGGGTILPGAMPPAHRWIGNPFFSLLARRWFGAPVRDVYCGLRAFERELVLRLGQRCTGMEFATEMILLASRAGVRMSEVAITLHPDGRRAHPPHLRTLRDGWRTLRLFLAHGARWSLREPGRLLFLAGLAGYGAALVRGSQASLTLLVLASGALLSGHLACALEVILGLRKDRAGRVDVRRSTASDLEWKLACSALTILAG